MGTDTWLSGEASSRTGAMASYGMSACLDKPCPTFARL